MKYEVLWVATAEDRRDYKDRQLFANSKKAVLYIEHHFNALEYDKPGTSDNPSSVLVATNGSQKSRDFAKLYSERVSKQWGYPNRGVDIVDSKRAGYWNLYYTSMPAVLLEPLYVSDPEQATLAMSEVGQTALAEILAQTIREQFPQGGLIAFSLGHKYRQNPTHKFDRGAPVKGGNGLGEADIAENVLRLTAELLTAAPKTEEVPKQQERYEFCLLGEWIRHKTFFRGNEIFTVLRSVKDDQDEISVAGNLGTEIGQYKTYVFPWRDR